MNHTNFTERTMKEQSTSRANAVSRRRFLQSSSLATAAFGMAPLSPAWAMTKHNQNPPEEQSPLRLWYDRPAKEWMTEALPIGNGPMGAMLFGGTDLERIQFNEISLWSGDRMAAKGHVLGDSQEEEDQNLGAHQAFGDIFIRLGHDPAEVSNYRRQLEIDSAIHRVEYDYKGVHYAQTAFASHPARAIVVHLAADKPASCSGRLWLTDMHGAEIQLSANRFRAVGEMSNRFEYEAQLQVLHQGGELKRAAPENAWRTPMAPLGLSFSKCDSVTLVLSAGTNFTQDHTKEWLGEHPHARVTAHVDAAAARRVDELLAEHVEDYQSLFRRFSVNLGRHRPGTGRQEHGKAPGSLHP